MSKELFISSSPHETKVAVLEDDELVEVYHERETGWALAGSIYKGRVTRVLPGMQSAFVDIGLERDALVATWPDRFLLTDHRPERDDSVLMRLSATTLADLAEVGELLDAAWRRTAPPHLAGRLEDKEP